MVSHTGFLVGVGPLRHPGPVGFIDNQTVRGRNG